MNKPHKYWSWQPWIRWFVPLPLLVWYSKRVFGGSHVWYQDEKTQLELINRVPYRANSPVAPEEYTAKTDATGQRSKHENEMENHDTTKEPSL